MLRSFFSVLLPIFLISAAHAEDAARFRLPRNQAGEQSPRAQRPVANPCAQFGPGFGRVEGSDTCVRIGGSVGISGGFGGGNAMPR